MDCSNPVATLLSKLAQVRRSGKGHQALCPAHDDTKPSLTVYEDEQGNAVVKCHSRGCSTASICAAVGMQVSDLFADSREKQNSRQRNNQRINQPKSNGAPATPAKPKGKIVAEYDYRDETGTLLFQAVRMDPKDFRQRRPKPGGGWDWSVKGVRAIPYRLPELLAESARPVVVVEGEKDVDNLAAIGVLATCNAGGAKKWTAEHAQHLRGRNVLILPDHDDAGREHAQLVAQSLHGIAAQVRIVELPGLAEKGDVSDWLAAGGTKEELNRLADAAPPWTPAATAPTDVPRGGGEERERKSASKSTRLVALAHDQGVELWRNPNGEPFASMPIGEHLETHKLRSRVVKQWLARLFYQHSGATAGSQALTDALDVLEGQALFDGAEHPAPLRLAEHAGRIYIDLANETWQAVEIDVAGWRVVDNPPVRFRRTKAMLPLPLPEQGGALDALREYVNVDAAGWPLVAAWLVMAARPSGPYPVLCLSAEQGSGKTTAASALRKLIDPNGAELRDAPRNPHELMIAATNGWIVGYDNLSVVPGWLSDCLCRLATGAGFSARQLYSDDEETILAATRPAMLTGIEDLLVRGDLLDRALLVNLLRIPPERRRTEREFWKSFDAQRPRMLGALLTAATTALRRLPEVHLDEKPRMADFAEWATAAEPALGLVDGEFLRTYNQNRQSANDMALEASAIAVYIADLVAAAGKWIGTAKELLAELDQRADENTRRQRGWPGTPKTLAGMLRRLAPNLRDVGIDLDLTQRSADRQRRRLITLNGLARDSCVQTVQRARNADAGGHVADDAPDGATRPACGNGGNAAARQRSLDDADDADAELQTKSFGGRVADANAALSMAADDASWGEI